MWDAISAWVVVAAERSVATSDELKNSEGWDAAIRADNRASKVPPDGALPGQEGGTPVEQGPYGGSQGWFNVGKRLRALSARAVLPRWRPRAPSPPWRHGRQSRQARPERGRRQQGRGQEVPRGGDRLRQAHRHRAGWSAGGERSRGAQRRVRAGRENGAFAQQGRAAQRPRRKRLRQGLVRARTGRACIEADRSRASDGDRAGAPRRRSRSPRCR